MKLPDHEDELLASVPRGNDPHGVQKAVPVLKKELTLPIKDNTPIENHAMESLETLNEMNKIAIPANFPHFDYEGFEKTLRKLVCINTTQHSTVPTHNTTQYNPTHNTTQHSPNSHNTTQQHITTTQ